jgi:hypothetical protein
VESSTSSISLVVRPLDEIGDGYIFPIHDTVNTKKIHNTVASVDDDVGRINKLSFHEDLKINFFKRNNTIYNNTM